MDLNVIITEQLRKNVEKFDRIREAYRNGVDTLDEYKENKRMVQEEKEMLEKQLADIKPAEPTIDTSKIAMLEKVRNVYEIIESDSVDSVTKNEILKLSLIHILDPIVVLIIIELIFCVLQIDFCLILPL